MKAVLCIMLVARKKQHEADVVAGIVPANERGMFLFMCVVIYFDYVIRKKPNSRG